MGIDFIVVIFLIFCLIASAYTMYKQQKEIKALRKENHDLRTGQKNKQGLVSAVHLIRTFMKEGLI